ncbi:MAG: hypothetical protein FWF69_06770, partial [Firmicutes bacterium]|nr:hypothetical protein [Bacillota bacterium]
MKKIYALIEKQGFFILLAVCVGVIAGSGLWALSMRGSEADMREVDLQYGQRLKDAELTRMAPPVTGSVLCDYGQAEWLPTLG